MSIHVVHIEDEKPLRNILGVALRTAEPTIQLQQFATGEEALPYIESNSRCIDLFVLDIRLPGSMSGLQVAQKIRDMGCQAHIVFTSAYSPPPQEFLEHMRAEYLPKPWHLVQLTEKLLKYKLDGIPAAASVGSAASPHGSMGHKSNGATASTIAPVAPNVKHHLEQIACPSCYKFVDDKHTVCAHCGTILTDQPVQHTMPVEQVVVPTRRTDGSKGEVELGKQAMLVFEIGDVSLTLPQANSMIIGRVQGIHPDAETSVDLTPFGAEQAGLSRRHLKLIRRDNLIYIADLGSMNGTWLNGRRLFANTEHLLREGDELRLSSLNVRVIFRDVPQTRPLG